MKPSRLTEDEFHRMQEHTVIGWRLLHGSKSRMLEIGASVALNHHERFDGSGYPNGLKGDKIPIEGRIVMTADIYDALRSKRPYKPALDHKTAVEIMLKGDDRMSRTIFDPEILDVFQKIRDVFADIFEQFSDSARPESV
jgi:putative two-component system response regulator